MADAAGGHPRLHVHVSRTHVDASCRDSHVPFALTPSCRFPVPRYVHASMYDNLGLGTVCNDAYKFNLAVS